jgi:uncharacterized protein YndB with AHSA1/START domain
MVIVFDDKAHRRACCQHRSLVVPKEEIDIRSGGVWRFVMHGPDGTDSRSRIIYTEVAEPEHIVYRHAPEKGTEPVSFESAITFEDLGERTRLTVRMLFPTAADRDTVIKTYQADGGLKQTLGLLDQHLSQQTRSTK